MESEGVFLQNVESQTLTGGTSPITIIRSPIIAFGTWPFPQSGIMKLFTNASFFALTTNRMSDIQNYRGETTWVLKPLKSANEGQ